MENQETVNVPILAETMLGDVMQAFMEEIKAVEMPWHLMSQRDQGDVIERIERKAKAMIYRCVEIVASGNRPTIAATVESVTVKDGLKAVLTMSRASAQRHELVDSQGSEVLVVVMNHEQYDGGDKPKAQKDQRELPLDQGGD